MQELALKMESDFTWTFMAGLALAILLFIVLVVVVSAMRVKTYKDRFVDVSLDNTEKTDTIAALENELKALKIKNAHNEQTLKAFAQTKELLKTTDDALLALQQNYATLENELAQTITRFETLQAMHQTLTQEHFIFKEQYDALQEDNNRLRTNNARLLMKLQSEERQASFR